MLLKSDLSLFGVRIVDARLKVRFSILIISVVKVGGWWTFVIYDRVRTNSKKKKCFFPESAFTLDWEGWTFREALGFAHKCLKAKEKRRRGGENALVWSRLKTTKMYKKVIGEEWKTWNILFKLWFVYVCVTLYKGMLFLSFFKDVK